MTPLTSTFHRAFHTRTSSFVAVRGAQAPWSDGHPAGGAPTVAGTVGGSGSLRRDSPIRVAPLPSDSFPHHSLRSRGGGPYFVPALHGSVLLLLLLLHLAR